MTMTRNNPQLLAAIHAAGFNYLGEFARAVGDDQGTLSRILSGMDTSMERKYRYCAKLGVHIDEIFPKSKYPNRRRESESRTTFLERSEIERRRRGEKL